MSKLVDVIDEADHLLQTIEFFSVKLVQLGVDVCQRSADIRLKEAKGLPTFDSILRTRYDDLNGL